MHENSYAENANFWIKIIRERLDRYRTDLTDAALLHAVGDVRGSSVLDAGCGEGYVSRYLAQRGAGTVIGVDACADLIDAARTEAKVSHLAIDYHVVSVEQLPFSDQTFDVVVCNHLVNDLQHVSGPFAEIGRVLKPSGRFVIMMLHPSFYTSHAEREPARHPLHPVEYFSVRTVEQHFKVAGITSPAPVRTWHRPLQDYITALSSAGFVIETIDEPHPSTEQMTSDPWWRENFVRPLFLLLVARQATKQDTVSATHGE